ncbi:hypothetical protein [Streptomyces prunicolor]|uniref:hypothetical protein n=1 Tax=Streptomyces prunicolor TaxID=67348 RepID=UPI00036CF8D0|nr:hypothetical protein [Streptomyces prunicolor]
MSLQTAARWWAFIDDRLDERMRAQYPEGLDAYQADWRAAHSLVQDHAHGVACGDDDQAAHVLLRLREVAADWDGHPDHPDRAAA